MHDVISTIYCFLEEVDCIFYDSSSLICMILCTRMQIHAEINIQKIPFNSLKTLNPYS